MILENFLCGHAKVGAGRGGREIDKETKTKTKTKGREAGDR